MSEMDLDRTRDKDHWIEEYERRINKLQAELERERKFIKCSVLCRCEDPYSPSRKQAARDCIEIIVQKTGMDFITCGRISNAIEEKFGLEI